MQDITYHLDFLLIISIIDIEYFIVLANFLCLSIYTHTYTQYLTEVNTPLSFLQIFYCIFSCGQTEEFTLCYIVK